ncbi:hypothetical protein ABZ860_41705 [Microbispora sp. NPDC046973]|uniref:hypothetical protein n=1 Tax=Microbispora sp. NPDC046973 TaxID=3155022 RepID=UPI0033D39E97
MTGRKGSQLGMEAAHRLAQLGCCEIEEGLSEAELTRIEHEYGFEFADDHRAFLAAGLPVHGPRKEGQTWENPWPDWRNGDPDALRKHVEWPVDYLLWDVEHGHWRSSWGKRPNDSLEAVELARVRLADVPRMVPVYGHRFLPAGRGTLGHPVLSMWGTDIIYYGTDLLDYIDQEFRNPRPEHVETWQPHATVSFWQDYL